MTFDELNKKIPYVVNGKRHSQLLPLILHPEFDVAIAQPGKYAEKTKGGDFIVIVTDEDAGWKKYKFKHEDFFKDIQEKINNHTNFMQEKVAPALAGIIYNRLDVKDFHDFPRLSVGVHPLALLYGALALAVAEHRRYAKFERYGGGRYLPTRFALGIIFGRWTEVEATEIIFEGINGLRKLEEEHGKPPSIKSF